MSAEFIPTKNERKPRSAYVCRMQCMYDLYELSACIYLVWSGPSTLLYLESRLDNVSRIVAQPRERAGEASGHQQIHARQGLHIFDLAQGTGHVFVRGEVDSESRRIAEDCGQEASEDDVMCEFQMPVGMGCDHNND